LDLHIAPYSIYKRRPFIIYVFNVSMLEQLGSSHLGIFSLLWIGQLVTMIFLITGEIYIEVVFISKLVLSDYDNPSQSICVEIFGWKEIRGFFKKKQFPLMRFYSRPSLCVLSSCTIVRFPKIFYWTSMK